MGLSFILGSKYCAVGREQKRKTRCTRAMANCCGGSQEGTIRGHVGVPVFLTLILETWGYFAKRGSPLVGLLRASHPGILDALGLASVMPSGLCLCLLLVVYHHHFRSHLFSGEVFSS
jgi:hypothetical protein